MFGYRTHLFARNGVPHQYWLLQMQRIENRYDIVPELPCGIATRWRGGLTSSAPSDPIYMELLRELRGKTRIDVSSVSSTGKQYEIASRTAPIENFKSDIRSDRNETLRWVGSILAHTLRRARKRKDKVESHRAQADEA